MMHHYFNIDKICILKASAFQGERITNLNHPDFTFITTILNRNQHGTRKTSNLQKLFIPKLFNVFL